jgi:hypothetical protein
LEKAAHNAVINSFPGCQLMCCQFHLAQCWFRQIQKNKILLREYGTNSELSVWLKHFFGIPYLPSNKVGNGFIELISIIPKTQKIIEFTDYILDTYITENAIFPPYGQRNLEIIQTQKMEPNHSMHIIILNFIHHIQIYIK